MDLVKGWMMYGGVKYESVDMQLAEVWALLEEAGMAEWARMFIAGDLYEHNCEKDYLGEDDYGSGVDSSIDHQQIGLEAVVGVGAAGGGLRRRTQSQRRQLDSATARGSMYI